MRDSLKKILTFINENLTVISFLTLIAVFITALSTCLNVVNQRQQFNIVNRAKILHEKNIISDSITGGKVILKNDSNLPA